MDRLLTTALSILYYFYHVPFILVGFFPWAVFLGPPWSKRSGAFVAATPGTTAACWPPAGSAYGSCSGLSARRNCRITCCRPIPALALLTACFIDRWQEMGRA